MKKVIINADDFGLSNSINKGIIESALKGVVTSTSLMVNMQGFEDAINIIKQSPFLDVGIHINLIRGNSIAPLYKMKSLMRKEFFLGSVFSFFIKLYQKKINLNEVELECRAQIEKALRAGVNITHIDSDKHIHMLQPLLGIFIKIAKEYNITKIRFLNELPYVFHKTFNAGYIFNKNFYGILYHHIYASKNKSVLTTNGIKTTDFFYGMCETGNMVWTRYEFILRNLKNGSTEIMCHPGYIDEGCKVTSLLNDNIKYSREKEIEALCGVKLKKLIQQSSIQLINFKEL